MDRFLWKIVGGTRRTARLLGQDQEAERDMVCWVLTGLTRLPDPVGANALYVLMKVDRTRRANAALEDFESYLANISSGDVCIDAGANFGVMTMRLAATGATVHAFEPDPLAFEKLQRAAEGWPNVVLHNKALSTQAGTVTLHRSVSTDDDPVLTEGSSLIPRSRTEGSATIDVEAVDIADLIEALHPKPIKLVKMDVEGGEINLLKHLIARDSFGNIKKIYVETHERLYPEHKMEIIKLLGYTRKLKQPMVNFDWP